MARRLDLYIECNLEQAPQELFTAECCSRCLNPECTRSQYGKSHFEDRVMNWHDRMFKNPPRMSPDDPRFEKLSAQKFVMVEPAIVVLSGRGVKSSSDWGGTPVSTPAPVISTPVPAQPAPVSTIVPVSTPVPAEVVAPTEKPLEPKPEPKPGLAQPRATLNTPVKPAQMIPNAPPPTPASGWESPPPRQSGAPVVKPGAKIKFGE